MIEIPVPEILAMEAPRLIPEPEAPGEATENLIPPTAPVPVDLPACIANSPAAILDPAASIPRRKEVVAVPEVLRPKIIVLVVMFELPPWINILVRKVDAFEVIKASVEVVEPSGTPTTAPDAAISPEPFIKAKAGRLVPAASLANNTLGFAFVDSYILNPISVPDAYISDLVTLFAEIPTPILFRAVILSDTPIPPANNEGAYP